MAIDTAQKRRAVAGLSVGWGITPDATPDEYWRASVGWGYSFGPAEVAVTGHYYMQDDAGNSTVVGTDTLANAAFITADTSDQTTVGPNDALPSALVCGALASPYIRVNGGTRLDSNNTLQTFTLAFWLKLSTDAECTILTSDTNGTSRCMQYDAAPGAPHMFMFDLNDNEDGLLIGTPTMTNWNHFAVTAEPHLGTCWLRMYVNGVQTAFVDVGFFNIEYPFGVGAISTGDKTTVFSMADFFWNPDVTYSGGQIRALGGFSSGSPSGALPGGLSASLPAGLAAIDSRIITLIGA